jgi:biopolymer transport protein TolR
VGTSHGRSGGLQSEINVTPLVDVVLVLLIIFMVIVPLTLRGYDVDIPGEASGAPPPERDEEQVLLSIEPEGCPVTEPPEAGLPRPCHVRVNDEEVAIEDLSRRVAEIFENRHGPDRVLFLAAHDSLNYEGVMRIVDVARSGVEDLRIGVVAERASSPGAEGRV